MIGHAHDRTDQLLQQPHVAQHVGDQLPGTVLFVKPQRQALEMLEHLEAHVDHNAVDHVTAEITRDVAHDTADEVDREHRSGQNEEQTVIGCRQYPVNGDLQHPRQGQRQGGENQIGQRSEKNQTAIWFEKRA
ncbi:hypothetical protein SDC9_98633 [bioreactor metagenome]|uniref:Uncharacterized protein n=1 Tax=bioreactor metagenome TaxID=1076179 RepID=A0A645AF97_9ZZZZ